MRRISALVAAIFVLLIFAGCEDEKESNLFKAQTCIDTATSATVAACESFLGSDTSERSYILRCSIGFIAEGITETAIVDAFENINNQGEGTDPTIATFSALSMSSVTASTETLADCVSSGSDSLIAIANAANLATAVASLGGILNDPSEANIQAFLDGYNAGTTDATDLGNAVIASQGSLCNTDSGLFKDSEACDNINQAIASGATADQIGDALIANINNPDN